MKKIPRGSSLFFGDSLGIVPKNEAYYGLSRCPFCHGRLFYANGFPPAVSNGSYAADASSSTSSSIMTTGSS